MGARLLMISHAQTQLNRKPADRVQGWMQDPLDERGRHEAQQLAVKLVNERIDVLLCSDRRRSQQTAAIIGSAIGLRCQASSTWRPWGMGQLEGMRSEDARPYIRSYTENEGTKIPGGESMKEFQRRLLPALARVLAKAKRDNLTVAIVTHSRDLALTEDWLAAGGKLEGLKLTHFLADKILPGTVLELTPSGDFWKSRLIDAGEH